MLQKASDKGRRRTTESQDDKHRKHYATARIHY